MQPELSVLLKNIPQFKARFENDPQEFLVYISDHEPVVVETPLGIFVSFNIWCPGSRISSLLNPTQEKGVLDKAYHEQQMQLMAKYLVDLILAGVDGLMLQEVPNPNSIDFVVFESALKKLCDKNNVFLELMGWSPTIHTRSGTCALINTQKLTLAVLSDETIKPFELKNRFGHYEICLHHNAAIKYDVYNIHGEPHHAESFADFIIAKVAEGAMVCGDFNIPYQSRAAEKLSSALPVSGRYKLQSGKLHSLDGFYVPLAL